MKKVDSKCNCAIVKHHNKHTHRSHAHGTGSKDGFGFLRIGQAGNSFDGAGGVARPECLDITE
jgi:hypothetical protein